MSRSPRLLALLTLVPVTAGVLIASCLPDPHSLVGRPCDAQHACGDEALVCCAGTCHLVAEADACRDSEVPDSGGEDGGVSDGGTGQDGGTTPDAGPECPPNLLTVGGFEQNSDLGQYQRTGSATFDRTTSVVRTGTGAVRVTRDTTRTDDFFGVMLQHTVLAGQVREGPTYCLALWMTRGDVRGEMRLISRRYGPPGGPGDYDAPGTDRLAKLIPNDDAWYPVITSMSLSPSFNYSINFRTSVDSTAGTVYYADDARVWESPDGGCEERCAP